MIAPIATFLRPLSSLSLALSSPDPVRAALEATVDQFSKRVTWATIAVAVGVAFEGVEFIRDTVAWIERRHFRKTELGGLKELAETVPVAIRVDQKSLSSHQPGWLKRFDRWAKRFGRIGLIVVVIGVVGEWRYGSRLEDAHDAIQRYDLAKLIAAEQDAGDAKKSAIGAEGAAKDAKDISDNAKTSATTALTIARGARSEANSFAADIKSAKTQAAEAESHLADALQRAADATEEMHRLKSNRSLTQVSELVSTLKAFKGTEYMFSGVFGDEESGNLLRAIDDLLQRSEWKKVPPVHRFPMLNFSDKRGNFEVPSILSSGIQVLVDSSDSPESLNALPAEQLPPPIRAAVALNSGIFSSLFPPQETGDKMLQWETGTSATVQIFVGKKP